MTDPDSVAAPEPRAAVLALRDEVGKVVVGQDGTVSGLVAALLVRGHVLLEGVPGVAKTLLVKTLARALDLEFARVQFTPDLMPSDVVGQLVYDAGAESFRFRDGPVFTNLLLADEINRTPPKTQSALLEAMEERQVSLDGDAHPLPDPFVVVATQNPVEYEGTYPLPEAQLDRFLFKLHVGYPTAEQEVEVLARHDRGLDPHDLAAAGVRPVASAADLAAARQAIDGLTVEPPVLAYIVELVRATRISPSLTLGVSPRGRRIAAARGQGMGVARRSRLRHARRGEGSRQAGAASPPAAPARGGARGRDGRRRPRRHPRLGAGAPVTAATQRRRSRGVRHDPRPHPPPGGRRRRRRRPPAAPARGPAGRSVPAQRHPPARRPRRLRRRRRDPTPSGSSGRSPAVVPLGGRRRCAGGS